MIGYKQVTRNAEEKQRLAEKIRGVEGASYGTLPCSADKAHNGWTSNRIEPVMFMFMLATKFSEQVMTNLLESRECLVSQGLGAANCTEPISRLVEDQVQPGVATVITVNTLLEAVPHALMALLVGPWSDHNGRKPFLVVSIAGYALSIFVWGVLSLIPGLGPAAFLFASAPATLSGGFNSFYLLCYCYLTDVTEEHSRAKRMAFLSLLMTVSTTLGTSASPPLLSLTPLINPYSLIFFISTFLLLLTALYVHVCLRETIVIKADREQRLFVFSHFKQLLSTCFERRTNHGRAVLLLLVWSLTVVVSSSSGEGSIMYLFVREMFSWQLSDYTQFQCFELIISGVGVLVGVTVLVDWLGLNNLAAAVVVLALNCVHQILKALAHTGSTLYLSSTVNVFHSTLPAFCRAELSRLVSKEDLGKVFALAAFQESVVPMLTTPVYTLVYEATFLSTPGTIYWMSSALTLLSATMLLIALVLQRSSAKMY